MIIVAIISIGDEHFARMIPHVVVISGNGFEKQPCPPHIWARYVR